MLYQFISRIKFLLNSKNQHGVHSPFVFDFVTKGLYKKQVNFEILENYPVFKNLKRKEQKVISKIISYFNIKCIHKSFKTSHKKCCIVYINKLKNEFTELKNIESCNNLVIVHGIHHSKENFLKWKEMIKLKNATVTIDVFYFGLIFFRKEQAKEHFIIRV